MKRKGLFITLEGPDGVGKTTHTQLLKSWLRKKRRKVVLTREPGGGPLAERVRKLLLDPNVKMENWTELFLYEAARIEHVQKVIRPKLNAGCVVLCDRFTDATLAYQGYARGLPKKTISELNHLATGGLVPDVTLLFDLSPHKSLKKAIARSPKKGDRLENEGLNFQKKVRQGYLALSKKYPRRIKRIPVQDTIEETQAIARKILEKRFHL